MFKLSILFLPASLSLLSLLTRACILLLFDYQSSHFVREWVMIDAPAMSNVLADHASMPFKDQCSILGKIRTHTAHSFSLTTLYTRLAVCCVRSLKNRTFRSLNTCFGLCKIFCIFLSRKFNSPTTTKYLASLPQTLSTSRRSRLPVERHEVNSSVL